MCYIHKMEYCQSLRMKISAIMMGGRTWLLEHTWWGLGQSSPRDAEAPGVHRLRPAGPRLWEGPQSCLPSMGWMPWEWWKSSRKRDLSCPSLQPLKQNLTLWLDILRILPWILSLRYCREISWTNTTKNLKAGKRINSPTHQFLMTTFLWQKSILKDACWGGFLDSTWQLSHRVKAP